MTDPENMDSSQQDNDNQRAQIRALERTVATLGTAAAGISDCFGNLKQDTKRGLDDIDSQITTLDEASAREMYASRDEIEREASNLSRAFADVEAYVHSLKSAASQLLEDLQN